MQYTIIERNLNKESCNVTYCNALLILMLAFVKPQMEQRIWLTQTL
nr:MAG TPA: hypothetical protein [Bacteriophage sp.]